MPEFVSSSNRSLITFLHISSKQRGLGGGGGGGGGGGENYITVNHRVQNVKGWGECYRIYMDLLTEQ